MEIYVNDADHPMSSSPLNALMPVSRPTDPTNVMSRNPSEVRVSAEEYMQFCVEARSRRTRPRQVSKARQVIASSKRE